jgi:translation elongation factor P/translation initiation factor 5A
LREISRLTLQLRLQGGGGRWNLAVSPNETAKTLTIKATSTVDPSKSATAIVTITEQNVETVNKTALITAISDANTAKSSVVVNTDATNVPEGTKWVILAEMTALTNAISKANTVKDNAAATQAEVNDATTALTTATTTFTNTIKTGTNTEIIAADKTALISAISAADAAKDGVATDTNAANVPNGSKWVTQEALDTFTSAIASAETVKNNAAATQAEVAAATTALANATSAFTIAINTGTKTGSGNNEPATDGAITVTLWVNESDDIFSVSPSNVAITAPFTATVATAYTTLQWYVDGAPVSSATTDAITINGAGYDSGKHRLGVMVIKDGAYYAKEITFTVNE